MAGVIMEKTTQKMGIQSVPMWEVSVKRENQKQPHWKMAFQQRCEGGRKSAMWGTGGRWSRGRECPKADTYGAWSEASVAEAMGAKGRTEEEVG